jgi:hypothetical protein
MRRIGWMTRTIAATLLAAVLGCSSSEGEPVKIPALMAATGVPPIDAAAPAKVETATFAVG